MFAHYNFPVPPTSQLHTNSTSAFRLKLLEGAAPADPRRIGLELSGDREHTGTMVLETCELDALVALLHDLMR